VSISDLIASRGLQDLLVRAKSAYGSMGIEGKHMQRCIEYTLRYGLNSARATPDHVPGEFYTAIAHVATRQVPDLLASPVEPRQSRPRSIKTDLGDSSLQYWIDKVCTALGIDAWLDDSLNKWFLDPHHPFNDLLVHACRRKVMDHIAACVTKSLPLDHDDLVLDIIHELQAKFPTLARFTRHLPAAIDTAIENDILTMPLVEPAPNGLDDYATRGLDAEPATASGAPSYPSRSIQYDNNITTTNTNTQTQRG